MIIDKKLIEEAKVKLGDRTPDLIADILHLEKYDERNKKACCFFHNEKTPSFSYDNKSMRFKCFGCGVSVDVIDAYKATGLTYVQAVEKLFAETEIEFAFSEHNIRTDNKYRYPHPDDTGDMNVVYKYLETRKISKATADFFDLKSDKHSNIVFNYYDENDVLCNVKYRPARQVQKSEPKMWFQRDADTKHILFNINRCNPTEPLVVCEGELDACAVFESGWHNVVSVPMGSQDMKWINECSEFLDQFDEIIIASDNDAAGEKMAKEVKHRLGTWRCKRAIIPKGIKVDDKNIRVKDMNEVLYWGGKQTVLDIILNAELEPVASVDNLGEVESVDLDTLPGLKTGFTLLDKEIFSLFAGTVSVMTATPGSGKTSFSYQLACNFIQQGAPVFLYGRELPARLTRDWLNYIIASDRNVVMKQNSDGGYYSIVDETAKKYISKFLDGKLLNYKDDFSCCIDDVIESIIACVRQYGVKAVILDSLMMLTSADQSKETLAAQAEIMNKVIEVTKKYNLVTILIAHPRKMQAGQELDMYDIAGNSQIVNLAHRTFGMKRLAPQENNGYSAEIKIIKDRILGKLGYKMPMYFKLSCRRFFTNYEEYAHRYPCDKNETVLKVPDVLQATESNDKVVFG